MRKEAMITQGYGKAAGRKHDKEQCDLKPVDSEEIEIYGHCGERKKQSTNKE
jgi:hypothetical protein